jgi:hypothetical protein
MSPSPAPDGLAFSIAVTASTMETKPSAHTTAQVRAAVMHALHVIYSASTTGTWQSCDHHAVRSFAWRRVAGMLIRSIDKGFPATWTHPYAIAVNPKENTIVISDCPPLTQSGAASGGTGK